MYFQEKGVDFSKFDFVITPDPFKNRLLDMFEVNEHPEILLLHACMRRRFYYC